MPSKEIRERLSRLLIVEDDKSQRRTLTDLMTAEGFQVVTADTANAALEHFKRKDFGVAIVDLRLPDSDGTQLLSKIKELKQNVSVIINTAHASFDSAKEAVNLGAFAYVEKAGDPGELIRHAHAAVRWHLGRYAEDLENAVSARTTELREANEELRREIAQRKLAEEERRAMEAQLRQAQKMEAIGQLAGGVAHDFNNLLTVILGGSEMLLSTIVKKIVLPEEKLRVGLEHIQLAGKQAASLTRQLLAFSRRETVRPEVLDPKKLVTGMDGLLRRMIGKQIQLDVDTSAGSSLVLADPGQIEQIVLNLAVNAADAMPKGGQLRISVEDVTLEEAHVVNHVSAKPGHHVLLSVVDNGAGMSPETMEHMFEPFFTTKPVGKGTGLGLATVYGTTAQLGGHLKVVSAPDVGSTFSIYIPVVQKPVTEERLDAVPPPASRGGTVLVCEDQCVVRDIMCESLRAAGFTVIEAENGQRALELASDTNEPIDLLISDVVMSKMSGTELADSLVPKHPDMSVLFVSGYAGDQLDAHGTNGRVVELLQKPFGPTALLRRVLEVMEGRAVGP